MNILKQIENCQRAISLMTLTKQALVDKAINIGYKWQDIAKVDKFAGIKLYADIYGISLSESHKVITKFLDEEGS